MQFIVLTALSNVDNVSVLTLMRLVSVCGSDHLRSLSLRKQLLGAQPPDYAHRHCRRWRHCRYAHCKAHSGRIAASGFGLFAYEEKGNLMDFK